MKRHTKAFGIYHWDTFDNETMLIAEADTREETTKIIAAKYAGRIGPDGADQLHVVDSNGNVVERLSVK